jgi:ribosomal-protein-alanine N-acetyltransferase
MLIRSMVEQDIDTIVRLEKQIFTSAWTKDHFRYELTKNPFSNNLVLEKEATIIGYIGFWLLGDQTQITTLGVCPTEQGRGYAKALMDACIRATEEQGYTIITLEVRVSNVVATSLYQRYGFEIVTTRKNYYQDTNEDAYLMLKRLEV